MDFKNEKKNTTKKKYMTDFFFRCEKNVIDKKEQRLLFLSHHNVDIYGLSPLFSLNVNLLRTLKFPSLVKIGFFLL